ncbi:hypothetical protein [Haliscomenobacter hydrossis]|uniref:Phosphate-selective porin O and P n=1 Tax=Haliscomenobacter hydrossis (strain ATCC 27775 / DSM 1100 / LMG 10767 / O) TaxID=760192 RepID=F4L8F6_HALH1|nr:hypothetical protein [Haliscomenobacter hydrossis]AEE54664.1 hypothetical protein Halhy_6855 [Haliscomenobacter hydrossis DSM 1100]
MGKYITQILLVFLVCFGWPDAVTAQLETPVVIPAQGFTFFSAKDSSVYIRFLGLMQFWARSINANPGTMYKNQPVTHYADFTIRRLVAVSLFQLHPRLLFVTGLGSTANASSSAFQTNLNLGFADAYGEYKFSNKFYLGAGLHQWTGFSRLNLEAIGTMVNLDIPKFQFPFINQLDRNNRMLGVYIKGELGRFDYRLSLNDPFTPTFSTAAANTGNGSPAGGMLNAPAGNAQIKVAYFNPSAKSKLLQGYYKWQFLDKELHKIPYETGNYLGLKRVFNLGAGFAFRKKGMLIPTSIEALNPAMPASETNPVLLKSADSKDIFCFAADAFLAYRFSSKLDGINIYTGYFYTNLGDNFYTVSGTNQTVSATPNLTSINGPGAAIPAAGTGNTFYFLTGYLLPKGFINQATRWGLFGTYQHSTFEALQDPVHLYELGVNWLITGNGLKLTAQYRNRPIFQGVSAFGDNSSTAQETSRKGELALQMQLNF